MAGWQRLWHFYVNMVRKFPAVNLFNNWYVGTKDS